MGTIYRARDLQAGTLVALKLLGATNLRSNQTKRFVREAQLLAELSHPAIAAYVAHGQTLEGIPYLAMQWLDGKDLAQRLSESGLTLYESLALAQRIAAALAVAHRRGIIHRDIKPSNLFLQEDCIDRAMLLDFGIARDVLAEGDLTTTGDIIGTPKYMAPEQASGQQSIGPACDVFSLGCVLFECLSGQPPFEGDHAEQLLSRLLVQDSPRLRALRAELPESLDALLARMLAKKPEDRPQDAEALCAELAALPELPDLPPPEPKHLPLSTPENIEQQLVSVILAVWHDHAESELPTLDLDSKAQQQRDASAIQAALFPYGAQIKFLHDGSAVVTLSHGDTGSAKDQALQAARCALALKEYWPDAQLALVTGRGMLSKQVPVGEAVERAWLLLGRMGAALRQDSEETGSKILLDDVSAGLLYGRVEVSRLGTQSYVLRSMQVEIDAARPLLGKPTPCVGRERELTVLDAVWRECCEEQTARVVLVLAAPGIGKSRLRYEFVRRLQSRNELGLVLIGRGDMMRAGTPYGLLGQAIHSLCEIGEGDPLAERQHKLYQRVGRHLSESEAHRVSEFLGELCRIPSAKEASPALHAARQDPRLMSDQITQAALDFFKAECAQQPLLLILEDLHWGDILTVRLVDAILRELQGAALMVLALSRPDVEEQFPKLWAERGRQDLRLQGLTKKACERLIQQVLGDQISPEARARIVEQASGNVLYLEELIRSIAEGKGELLPETVLAMLQARLMRLEPGARRVLRTGSVYGQTFWRGGLSAEDVDLWLQHLIDGEFIERHRDSRFPGEIEYGFRHALMREAAYSLLSETEQILAHRQAGHFLVGAGETEALIAARHFEQGKESTLSVEWYVRAAEQCFSRYDTSGTRQHAEHAIALGATGELRGIAHSLQALGAYWTGDWEPVLENGREALSLCPPGSVFFCRALSVMIMDAVMRREEQIAGLVGLLLSTAPQPAAIEAYMEAGSFMVLMSVMVGQRPLLQALLDRMTALTATAPDESQGRALLSFCHGSALRHLAPEPFRARALLREAHALFQKAEDRRSLVLASLLLGLAERESGDAAAGEKLLRQALVTAARLDAPLVSVAQLHLSMLLERSDTTEAHKESEQLARAVAKSFGVNAIYVALAQGLVARGLLRSGKTDEAVALSRVSSAGLELTPVMQAVVMPICIDCERASGDLDAAARLAPKCMDLFERLGDLGYVEPIARMAAAEALYAAAAAGGPQAETRRAQAEQLARSAADKVQARAATAPSPEAAQRFLHQLPENRRAIAGLLNTGVDLILRS